MTMEPQSSLTMERPDIWDRALQLAVETTGYRYRMKHEVSPVLYTYGYGYPLTKEEQERIDRQIQEDHLKWLKEIRKLPRDKRPPPCVSDDFLDEDIAKIEREIENNPKWKKEIEGRRRKNVENEIADIDRDIERLEKKIDKHERDIEHSKEIIEKARREIDNLKEKKASLCGFLDVLNGAPQYADVPEGSVESLLHEVGHWVVSDPFERMLPNYGIGNDLFGHSADREWQAWAFEEIVFAPFGPARHFASPTWRDGNAFMKNGPMPAGYLWHAEREIKAAGVDVEAWRAIVREWVRWGESRGRGRAPWEMVD